MEATRFGFLLVMMQPPPAFEDEFNAWYDTEHIPERQAVPGFLSARRFVSIEGHPRYLALYDLERRDVLDSEAYLNVSGDRFSPWTRRVTSRVLVDRRTGSQLYPGDAVTGSSARLMLLRFHDVAGSDEGGLTAALRSAFEGRTEAAGLRLLACDDRRTHFALAQLRACPSWQEVIAALDRFSTQLDLANVYAPYDSRL
jgi:hypothetical protein